VCDSCATKGVYNLHCITCAARYLRHWSGDITETAESLINEFGHDRERLREEYRSIEKAR
jgi:hypothetical protein